MTDIASYDEDEYDDDYDDEASKVTENNKDEPSPTTQKATTPVNNDSFLQFLLVYNHIFFLK